MVSNYKNIDKILCILWKTSFLTCYSVITIPIYCQSCVVSQKLFTRSKVVYSINRILFLMTSANLKNMTTASCQLALQCLMMFNRAQRTTVRPASPSRRSPPRKNFRYRQPYRRWGQQRASTRLYPFAHPPALRL